MAKKKIHRWCLSVDFEGGDGPDLFPVDDKNPKKDAQNRANFWSMLNLTSPPPKVTLVGLTKAEWAKAVRVGRERAS